MAQGISLFRWHLHMILLDPLFAALQFTADFKLGHYMKIPPRPMFWCQVRAPECRRRSELIIRSKVIATIIAGTVQLGVQSW
jgi:hypothetical protein